MKDQIYASISANQVSQRIAFQFVIRVSSIKGDRGSGNRLMYLLTIVSRNNNPIKQMFYDTLLRPQCYSQVADFKILKSCTTGISLTMKQNACCPLSCTYQFAEPLDSHMHPELSYMGRAS